MRTEFLRWLERRGRMINQLKQVREALKNAKGNILEWGSYAGSYHQEKWDLQGDAEEIEEALTILDQLIAEQESNLTG